MFLNDNQLTELASITNTFCLGNVTYVTNHLIFKLSHKNERGGLTL